jgi:hypothetical protein
VAVFVLRKKLLDVFGKTSRYIQENISMSLGKLPDVFKKLACILENFRMFSRRCLAGPACSAYLATFAERSLGKLFIICKLAW